MQLNKIDSKILISSFLTLVDTETRITAEIVEHVREIDARKLYLELDCTSLYQYLTEKVGYTPGSAQRRINAARLMHQLPEVGEQLRKGTVNLVQLSQLACAIREKEKTAKVPVSQKREILASIQNCNVQTSEQIICANLEIEPKAHDKARIQADGSVRVEATLNKEQLVLFERVKQLISHTHPNPSFAEVMEHLARYFIKRKDAVEQPEVTATGFCDGSRTATVAAEAAEQHPVAAELLTQPVKSGNPRYVSPKLRRQLFQEQSHCQWRHPQTGAKCESKFPTPPKRRSSDKTPLAANPTEFHQMSMAPAMNAIARSPD